MRRAIRENLRDFVAIVALFVLAIAVVLVILVRQGTPFPAWVPGIGSDRFALKAEFTSAQAVTPGQGQTVDIAGIKVGTVSGVELENDTAVVDLQVDDKYASLIHPDATLLLRPKTGLQDMVIEVDPGTGNKQIEEGSTVPTSQTEPNVNPDQFLATLDADTRDYLRLLLSGGGEGLGGRGKQLSAGLRRLEPTARDIARITTALAARRQNISRVIHNFRLLSETLGSRDTQLAEFIDSSNAVLGAFANQEASIRAALRELPGTLRETRGALASTNRLALVSKPALARLRPSARALAPALRQSRPFFRETRGPIKNQIRPFTRTIKKPVKHLNQASGPLKQTTSGLNTTFTNLNYGLNELAYNPPGSAQESFLFWAAWLSHDLNGTFLTQDANGPLRRGIVLQDCTTAQFAEGIAATRPFLRTLQQVTNVTKSEDIPGCALVPPGL
jgi:phospholipid/cholesterol/gamma-HCH transport system substrate-binding protein